MKAPTKTAWSRQDEEALKRLQARREEFIRENRKPLETLLCRLPSDIYEGDFAIDNLTDWFIQNADQVRDLLQPFDSGVRCSEKSA